MAWSMSVPLVVTLREQQHVPNSFTTPWLSCGAALKSATPSNRMTRCSIHSQVLPLLRSYRTETWTAKRIRKDFTREIRRLQPHLLDWGSNII
jgi:hypothetical protein